MEQVTIDFSTILCNVKGEPIKDMIDPPIGRTEATAPDLTLGSLIVNALTLGIASPSIKESAKYYRIAVEIEQAMRNNNGKLDYTEGKLSQLEEALGKVQHPMFNIALYAGIMQSAVDKAKTELSK